MESKDVYLGSPPVVDLREYSEELMVKERESYWCICVLVGSDICEKSLITITAHYWPYTS